MRLVTAPAAPLLALILSLTHVPAAAQPVADGRSTPRFEEAACPFAAPRSVQEGIRCGWVEVPENRAAPGGRRLRIAVAVLTSTSPRPRPDPVVFVMGGPGQGFVQNAPRVATSPAWTHVRAERDLILYDQRGTGFSEPEFCPSLGGELERLALQGLTRNALAERQRAAFARCASEMAEKRVDLSQYHSVASALDLRDLRKALGVAEWNVWGVSYGGRLALEALRTAPEGIRAVVLDSPLPPNVANWVDGPARLVAVLERTFERCVADAACAAAFPDVERRFWHTVASLEREPILLRTRIADASPDSMYVTGRLFAEGVFLGLYRPAFHAVLPLLVREVERRNAGLLGNVAQQMQVPAGVISQGLHWTVGCNEVAPFNGPAARPAPRDERTELLDRLGAGPSAEGCDALHPFRAGPAQAEPVASTIPTLIFAGALDPVTPSSYSRLAAATLPNARVVAIPGGGHWEANRHECTRRLMREFLADPGAPLEASCADSIQPPAFVTDVRLTPGIARVASALAPAGSPLMLAGAAAPLLVLLSAVLGWPAAAACARVRRRPRTAATAFERRARWGAGGVAALALAFLVALAWAVIRATEQNPYVLAFGLPAGAAPLLLLPWVLLAGSLGLIATAALAWQRGAWTRWGRIHFTLVATASAIFAATLFVVRLA
jgi:pimeloyl-ACP methyl ester carboxylesterase